MKLIAGWRGAHDWVELRIAEISNPMHWKHATFQWVCEENYDAVLRFVERCVPTLQQDKMNCMLWSYVYSFICPRYFMVSLHRDMPVHDFLRIAAPCKTCWITEVFIIHLKLWFTTDVPQERTPSETSTWNFPVSTTALLAPSCSLMVLILAWFWLRCALSCGGLCVLWSEHGTQNKRASLQIWLKASSKKYVWLTLDSHEVEYTKWTHHAP